MTDLVSQLVVALERCHSTLTDERLGQWHYMEGSQIYSDFKNAADQARAALTAAKAGGGVAVPDCPDGDVWFALSCGHVVMGWKHGDMLDWEAMIDHDCCSDAHAVKARPVVTPNPPKEQA